MLRFPRAPWPLYMGPTAGILCLVMLSCGKGGGETTPGGETDSVGEATGATIYATHCALCHGAGGEGDGVAQFDRPARSFVDGGFSFGNTVEALTRTVTHGIGGTPMYGFGETLSPDEIQKVVQHVIDLGPERDGEVLPGQTEMVVKDRALVIRGGLPPIADGLPGHPRGMLVGNADGLTLEYSTDPLRLLAVRQGLFANRRDWETRGGEPIEPLGKVIYRFERALEDTDLAVIQPRAGDSAPDLVVSLLATETLGPIGVVEAYFMIPLDHARRRDSVQSLHLGGWSGFERRFEFDRDPRPDGALDTFVISDDSGHDWTDLPSVAGSDWTIRWRMLEGNRSLVRMSKNLEELPGGGLRMVERWLFGLEATKENLDALVGAAQ